jgi:hypothetical protein
MSSCHDKSRLKATGPSNLELNSLKPGMKTNLSSLVKAGVFLQHQKAD